MDKAIGMMEYKTVSAGITAADRMLKTAEVEILQAQTVCPGKYIILLGGRLSAITAAIEAGKAGFEEEVIDSFILGNPHKTIFEAIYGTADIREVEALGIIETFSAASIVVAADTAAKTALVNLMEIRIARGMCGKSYVLLTGELAAVQASVDAACEKLKNQGMLLNRSVIPNPDPKLWSTIV